jgi:hypothetical protein
LSSPPDAPEAATEAAPVAASGAAAAAAHTDVEPDAPGAAAEATAEAVPGAAVAAAHTVIAPNAPEAATEASPEVAPGVAAAAAHTVARVFQVESEEHQELKDLMHKDGKIGRAALGDLTRSVNKVVINPFPEGQALMHLAHNAATHFSYSTRLDDLFKYSDLIPGGPPKVTLKTDFNSTRVSARYYLILSLIRMHKRSVCL